MKIRLHRGGFAESMATVTEIPATKQAICDYLQLGVEPEDLTVTPYFGIDTRNGWNTHLVSFRHIPVAFTDSPVTT